MTISAKASERVHWKPRSCDGKMKYGERAAKRAARMLRDKGDACAAYPCDHGAHWHVGHDREAS